MTKLIKPLTRALVHQLDGSFCTDRNKPLAVRLIPGTDALPDMLELWPKGTRRAERIAVIDVYRFAMRCRVNRTQLERAREKKIRKQLRLAALRQSRAEKKLFAK